MIVIVRVGWVHTDGIAVTFIATTFAPKMQLIMRFGFCELGLTKVMQCDFNVEEVNVTDEPCSIAREAPMDPMRVMAHKMPHKIRPIGGFCCWV